MSKKDKAKRANSSPAGGGKVPRVAQANRPGGPRQPRLDKTFAPPDPTGNVVVQFGRFDVGGPWCLSKITAPDHVGLLERIASIETMSMHEVVAGGAIVKDYEIERIPSREAKARLVALGYDDETRMSRIQISGPGRLYGFRRDDRFFALWWDPEHKIWPSNR